MEYIFAAGSFVSNEKEEKEKEIGCTGIILQTKEKGAFNNLKQGIKLTNR